MTALGAYLDKVVARTRELNLDGLSFSGIPVSDPIPNKRHKRPWPRSS